MTPRQVPDQTSAAPEGRLLPLLGAALGLSLLLASLWAAAAYRSALAAESTPQPAGPAGSGPAEGAGAPAEEADGVGDLPAEEARPAPGDEPEPERPQRSEVRPGWGYGLPRVPEAK